VSGIPRTSKNEMARQAAVRRIPRTGKNEMAWQPTVRRIPRTGESELATEAAVLQTLYKEISRTCHNLAAQITVETMAEMLIELLTKS